ncbi:hypothetical protein [Alkaliphilus sp. B6464]|uniref:hypothetical protein n=1 Tax=Alkaliphilus sp. B6464 TaxID=2731219 RepID=UPI001BA662B6|nr:hypothetical protein [Alkaliphilus sp. B6464]QUH22203.1 hypothetical protein HYG84_20055 [Alkaliphilus sp. B6464]
MKNEVKKCLERVNLIFPKSFINLRGELILEPKNNVYFRLEDVNTELDFKCKVIAWLSRHSCKGVSNYWQKRFLKGINEFLCTDFSKEDMRKIYTTLGNDANRKLCVKFIESNYDLSLLEIE